MKKLIVREELKTLCCPVVISPGETVGLHSLHSKSRVWVNRFDGVGLHKVKLSSLRRTTGNFNIRADENWFQHGKVDRW